MPPILESVHRLLIHLPLLLPARVRVEHVHGICEIAAPLSTFEGAGPQILVSLQPHASDLWSSNGTRDPLSNLLLAWPSWPFEGHFGG